MIANTLIHCKKCDNSKPVPEFYQSTIYNRRGDGECKCCVRARVNKSHQASHRVIYYNTNGYKRINADRYQKHAANNTVRVRARQLANDAIDRGDLIRPTNCECCNTSDVMIEAHHCDYAKPLDVMWLCKRCHADWHNNINNKTTGG